jgi:hypothetical protein
MSWGQIFNPSYDLQKVTGQDTSHTSNSAANFIDPLGLFGGHAADDVAAAGKAASARLDTMSQQAWQRQMQGLQLALSSMNNYNGILANLNGTPGAANYYDPNGQGGVLGQDPRMAGRPMPPPAAPPPAGASGPATEARRGRGHF